MHYLYLMEEKRRVLNSLFFPITFMVLIWMVKFFEISMELDFHTAGVMPRKLVGLQGILFSPLIHGAFLLRFSIFKGVFRIRSSCLFISCAALFYGSLVEKPITLVPAESFMDLPLSYSSVE